MPTDQTPETTRSQRWAVPVVGLAMGVGFIAVFLARNDPGMAVAGFVIMAAYVLILVMASRRSESAALLRGQTTDERRRAINQRASAFTLNVLVLVLLAGFVTELIRGHSGHPWDVLCAAGGVTYILATIYFSRRG
ncbi:MULTISPECIES: DUF2178 domain-containing protein [Streptomyces violaceusniger group]|uniref:DUF2178 domain-containing protein n=2 Tax=Streptomyces javensis TaxID=114698 RepID=A0ABS0R5H4_9ACTN|nr:DUF2178 domain-containing protein [Streptomyces javensis]MBI0312627.1 DUF2178 domain-containing protein [Streptomyces javensis]